VTRGDFVLVTYAGDTLPAQVLLVSANGRSLMLSFGGMLGGYIGSMPVLQDDAGEYRDLIAGEPVFIQPIPHP
jgi:hypothetical protein